MNKNDTSCPCCHTGWSAYQQSRTVSHAPCHLSDTGWLHQVKCVPGGWSEGVLFLSRSGERDRNREEGDRVPRRQQLQRIPAVSGAGQVVCNRPCMLFLPQILTSILSVRRFASEVFARSWSTAGGYCTRWQPRWRSSSTHAPLSPKKLVRRPLVPLCCTAPAHEQLVPCTQIKSRRIETTYRQLHSSTTSCWSYWRFHR